MLSRVLFSSETDEWSTPQDLFDRLNEKWRFTLDVCATSQNAKCPRYFTKEQDALRQQWRGGKFWMNPPYGEPEFPCKKKCKKKRCKKRRHHCLTYKPGIADFVRKAYEESLWGTTVGVCLLPVRSDTRWWHDYVMQHGRIEFLRGRLKFGGAKNPAPFPSAIVVFGGDWRADALER